MTCRSEVWTLDSIFKQSIIDFQLQIRCVFKIIPSACAELFVELVQNLVEPFHGEQKYVLQPVDRRKSFKKLNLAARFARESGANKFTKNKNIQLPPWPLLPLLPLPSQLHKDL